MTREKQILTRLTLLNKNCRICVMVVAAALLYTISFYKSFESASSMNNKPDSGAVCVITCSFSFEKEHMDDVMDAWEWSQNERLNFYFFSNLDLDHSLLGWHNIQVFDPRYRRMITQSRWPKFLGWQHPTIDKNCLTVFYLDASSRPGPEISDFASYLFALSKEVLQSQMGIALAPHPKHDGAINGELEEILLARKDTLEHVEASKQWLSDQIDFVDSMRVYQLTYFMYSIHSIYWRNLTTFFWKQYSLENFSWRDQPLFAYSMHHFNLSAIPIRNDIFFAEGFGYSNHKYTQFDELPPVSAD